MLLIAEIFPLAVAGAIVLLTLRRFAGRFVPRLPSRPPRKPVSHLRVVNKRRMDAELNDLLKRR